jgi:hypothetical protein
MWPVVKMRKDKYKDKSAPMRIFHTYTGYIVLVTVLLLIAIAFQLHSDTLYFFESWSCEQMRDYLLNDIQYSTGDKKHIDLTNDEHLRLHQIYAECEFMASHDD